MKTDLEIKQDVLEELEWQPILRDAQIGIEVKFGIVRLSGIVRNLAEKLVAENTAKKIIGVKAVADDIEVKIQGNFTDTDLTTKINFDLEWNTSVPEENIDVKVEDGHVFLSGNVKWGFQKSEAEKSLQYIDGIKSITNTISINSINSEKESPINIEQNINRAFERSASIDAKNITVLVEGNTAILQGKVNSIKEKDDAQIAAYLAEGITNVKNELKVEYDAIYL
ncbi:BON domain-containing protein [Bizionia myxarmorum]|uniref:BON domain-containing protein n=1 Tax=Bizionia myxarmorum TaxID=291186 RepID=A0A5D0RFL9_9FLAO|nr:BON domain-containing protein [Bizionia myxarmorum]TYB79498.1 BON domain-containing protein [Bizionia myxarmorum]